MEVLTKFQVPPAAWFRALSAALILTAVATARPAHAYDADSPPPPVDWMDSGKLLATSGVSQIEGAGGGGLVPWALITGYGTRDAIGGNVHYTLTALPDFTLQSGGFAIGLFDRVEFSYAHEWFDTRSAGAALGLGTGFTFHEDVVGLKVKLIGDAVYDQDSWIPQIAAGVQYKSNDKSDILRAIGARYNEGVDYYLAATKLLLQEQLLVNVTLRETKANQFGILGFGGDRDNSYSTQAEASAAYLINRHFALGAEYRMKPDNLRFAEENNAYDVFAAYFLNKNLAATIAYVGLGSIATRRDENGFYLSIQGGF